MCSLKVNNALEERHCCCRAPVTIINEIINDASVCRSGQKHGGKCNDVAIYSLHRHGPYAGRVGEPPAPCVRVVMEST